MPRNNLTELSATDAENTDVKGVSIAEGMAPSGVNNAIRAVAAMLADAFAAAAPGTKLTAVKAANVIVADTTDRLTIGTTSPTLVSHDNSTTTTTVDAERNLTLEVGTTGTPSAFKVDAYDSSAKRTVIEVGTTAALTLGDPNVASAVTVDGSATFTGVAQPSLNTTTTWDASAKQTCSITASGATTVTLSNVSSLAVGTPLTLVVADASGASLTLAGTTFKYINATAPTLNGTAGETLIVSMLVIGSNTVAAASVTVS